MAKFQLNKCQAISKAAKPLVVFMVALLEAISEAARQRVA
jgi:hypothetical protein